MGILIDRDRDRDELEELRNIRKMTSRIVRQCVTFIDLRSVTKNYGFSGQFRIPWFSVRINTEQRY